MRALRVRLIFIDPNLDHPETKAPAYITRLLENLTKDKDVTSSGCETHGAPEKMRLISTASCPAKNFNNVLPKPPLNFYRRPMARKTGKQGQILRSVGKKPQKTVWGATL